MLFVTHFASFTLSIRPSSACNFRTTEALSDELQAHISCAHNHWDYNNYCYQ